MGAVISLFLIFSFGFPLPARAENKTVLVLPLVIYADPGKTFLRQGLKSMFTSRIAGEGLEVIRDDKLQPLLKESEKDGITSDERAEELARRLNAGYAIFGSITSLGTGYSLDLSVLELKEESSKLTRVSEAVEENQFITKLADVVYQLRAVVDGIDIRKQRMAAFSDLQARDDSAKGLFFKPTSEYHSFEPAGRISIHMGIMGLDVGDLNGDGNPELVVLGRKKVLVYNRRGKSLTLKGTYKAPFGENFLKISVGDGDKSGNAEIYLVGQYGLRAYTTVLEWSGKFKKRHRQAGHMMAAKYADGSQTVLLYKESKAGDFFGREVYLTKYDEAGKPTKHEPLPGLEGAQFYTLSPFDLNEDGISEWVGLGPPGLDEQAELYVWDNKGEALWSSEKRLGGTNNAIRVGTAPPGDIPPRIAFNGRVVVSDIDGDGKKEIVAVTNQPLVQHVRDFKVYVKGRLTAYSLEGEELVPAWKTRNMKYCLTDIQSEGGTLYLAAQKGKIEQITAGSSRILWFE